MARVLIIDDSELILQMLEMVVSGAGHVTTTVTGWAAAEAAYTASPPDVVITDLNLPEQPDPIAALQALGDTPIIIVSGRPQAELDRIAADRGAQGALSKDAGMMVMAGALPALIAAVV